MCQSLFIYSDSDNRRRLKPDLLGFLLLFWLAVLASESPLLLIGAPRAPYLNFPPHLVDKGIYRRESNWTGSVQLELEIQLEIHPHEDAEDPEIEKKTFRGIRL